MRFRIAACLTLLCAEALAAESVYTKIDLDRDCKQVGSDEVGVSARCAGYKDYAVHFAEGDLRQSIFYGYVGSWFEEGAFESFGGFNHAGATTEKPVSWVMSRLPPMRRPMTSPARWRMSVREASCADSISRNGMAFERRAI